MFWPTISLNYTENYSEKFKRHKLKAERTALNFNTNNSGASFVINFASLSPASAWPSLA